jgi:hypothetical protein
VTTADTLLRLRREAQNADAMARDARIDWSREVRTFGQHGHGAMLCKRATRIEARRRARLAHRAYESALDDVRDGASLSPFRRGPLVRQCVACAADMASFAHCRVETGLYPMPHYAFMWTCPRCSTVAAWVGGSERWRVQS